MFPAELSSGHTFLSRTRVIFVGKPSISRFIFRSVLCDLSDNIVFDSSRLKICVFYFFLWNISIVFFAFSCCLILIFLSDDEPLVVSEH